MSLSDEERERLNTLIRAGKHLSRQLTKARILLKADASETGEGWQDCEITAALDTSVDTVVRTRQQLVEELRCRACPQAFPSLGQSRASLTGAVERNGTANLFMMFAPLEGWRHVEFTDRHTAVDYAHVLKDLSDTHFPKAKKIVLVQDNLNT